MVEYSNTRSSIHKDVGYKYKNDSNPKSSKEDFSPNKMLIWEDENPAVLDNSPSLLKQLIFIGIGLIFLLCIYFITWNLVLATFGMILYYVLSFLIFHDIFFCFHHNLRYEIPNPFPQYQFWQLKEELSIIFLTNLKEQFTTGIKVFQIKVLPENVKANLERFISALATAYIPFSYQVVQKPLRSSLSKDSNEVRFQTLIYFALFSDLNGKLSPIKLDLLIQKLNGYSVALENNFLANFHHYKIQSLIAEELISSFSTFVLRNHPSSITNKPKAAFEETHSDEGSFLSKISFRAISKLAWVLGIIIMFDVFWNALSILAIYRVLSILGLIFLLYFLWKPSFRLSYSRQGYRIPFAKDVLLIDLFSKVSFFKLHRVNDVIFYQTQDGFVGGFKQLNLRFASVPIIPTVYIGHHNPPTIKVYEVLIQKHIPFTYTIQALPTSYNGLTPFSGALKRNVWNWMQHNLHTTAQQANWMAQRRGIWRTILTISCSYSIFDPSDSLETLEQIKRKLDNNTVTLKNAFHSQFPNCQLSLLSSQVLEMGILFELVKNNRITQKGTHLHHLIMQGFNIPAFLWLSDLFKKGIETKIATEFNSPLSLENFITIGWTINTEILTREIPAGFTKLQLDNLLITNGKQKQQILLTMHIVGELVKKNYPSIVFDFTGDWTRLIRQFEGTELENCFLYYKLGKTFNLDLVHSGIKHDPNNVDYLDYMFEAYANCFKKDDRTLDIFKNTLQRNLGKDPGLSSSTVALDLVSKPEWMRKLEPGTISVINFFKAFSRQELSYFHTSSASSSSHSLIEQLLCSDRTIIIDLSSPNGLEKKSFLMFVVLAKLIHYIRNGYDFTPKFITLPNIDLVFDTFFIDKNMRYGRISKFFEPFRSKGFGLLASASQARYLHSNLFAYFENIVSFKVVDKRDISVLKSIMGLDALHGSGIYSKSRNETYQIQYLMNMREGEAVVKRDDIYQPFPIEVDSTPLVKLVPYSWDEIVSYMKTQGFDLEYAVKKLIAETKQTLFEKDFGEYSFLIEPIISFLSDLRTMDQIGNLFAETIKKEMKIRLDAKLSQFTKDKKKKHKAREELFKILIAHGYLKEHHPAQASGSESVRTSYYVGPQFDKALEDFITIKKQIPTEVDIIQQESDTTIEEILGAREDDSNNYVKPQITPSLDINRLKEVIARINSGMFMELFEMDRAINRKDYRNGLEKAKQFIDNFIFSVYNGYYNVNYVITNKDLKTFVTNITNSRGFPYTSDQFNEYISLSEGISFQEGNLEQTLKSFYNRLQEFYNTMQSYVYSN